MSYNLLFKEQQWMSGEGVVVQMNVKWGERSGDTPDIVYMLYVVLK